MRSEVARFDSLPVLDPRSTSKEHLVCKSLNVNSGFPDEDSHNECQGQVSAGTT